MVSGRATPTPTIGSNCRTCTAWSLFADGGVVGSKPYAASGAYINRMSDYCGGCAFDPKIKSGPQACPFNSLYWDFLLRNRARLSGNPRLRMPYRALDAMSAARRAEIAADARAILDSAEFAASPPEAQP